MSGPFVLSIAGFDPSAGAGLLADIKTFEQLGVYGLSVCSAQTIQRPGRFADLRWAEADWVERQLAFLLQSYTPKVVKIGIIGDLALLGRLLDQLAALTAPPLVVWDPVLSASAGFDFQQADAFEDLKALIERVDVFMPNRQELERLWPKQSPLAVAQTISQQTALLLKGGHDPQLKGLDQLFLAGELAAQWPPKMIAPYDKHGTGCVLSSALTAFLALGQPLITAFGKAKDYNLQFMNSQPSLLGWHRSYQDE